MSGPITLASLAEATAQHRRNIADRFGGKSSEAGDQDPGAKGGEVTEGGEVLANLSDAERASLIEKAESGNEAALSIIEAAIEEAAGPQAGDFGGAPTRGLHDSPWNVANAQILKAVHDGRRRQTGRY